ncbi:MAG: DedA family protein, partial [archaeon]
MFETLFGFFLNNINYLSIFILMTIESSFIPFPSEVIMIPAGFLVATGKLNIFLAILFGILGSIVGAVINYVIGKYLGRKLILKNKKFFFINEKHLEWSEKYFKKHGV